MRHFTPVDLPNGQHAVAIVSEQADAPQRDLIVFATRERRDSWLLAQTTSSESRKRKESASHDRGLATGRGLV